MKILARLREISSHTSDQVLVSRTQRKLLQDNHPTNQPNKRVKRLKQTYQKNGQRPINISKWNKHMKIFSVSLDTSEMWTKTLKVYYLALTEMDKIKKRDGMEYWWNQTWNTDRKTVTWYSALWEFFISFM